MSVSIRRVYEARPADEPGTRILVDRVWPRGIHKESDRFDEWVRDVAPSDELRHWFGHDPAKWDEFQTRYRAEIAANPGALQPLLDAAKKGPLTLVYGAKDEEHNQAAVLRDVLNERLREER